MAVLILTGFVASARQPSVSPTLLNASGHAIGNDGGSIQVKITGTVVDADTGQPLPVFHLTTGALDRDHRSFDWSEHGSIDYNNGVFTVIVGKEKTPPAVLIEAEGYLPQCSGPVRGLETNVTFRLKKGRGPEGVLLTPDGRPAAGRTVYFSRLKDLVILEGTNLTPRKISSRALSMVTDQAGRFAFAPDLDGYGIMAMDDDGFASVPVADLASSPQVRLQPWARVEGVLKIGARPAPNETVRLADAFAKFSRYPRPMPPYSISASMTTDAQGRFVFPRVPPGDVKIFYTPKFGPTNAEEIPITQITNITLKAGEARLLTLGGQGRPVVGRVVLKNYHKTVDWQDQMDWIDSVAPEPADCPNFQAISQEFRAARRAARSQQDVEAAETRYLAEYDRIARQLRDYFCSPAGRQYWFSRRLYVLKFAPDGSFRIDDVPGGKYSLTIDLRELNGQIRQFKSPRIDFFHQEIEVPGSPGGHNDTPCDLGVINMVGQLSQGDLAPDFTVKTMDDKTVKLSDYRGKYVLLNFWASASASSLAGMAYLKDTSDAFQKDPRFAMIGLNVDSDPAAARAMVANHKIAWPQGMAGKWSDGALPEQYGIKNLPYVVLIDPGGRVFAPGLSGGAIKSAVEAALAGE